MGKFCTASILSLGKVKSGSKSRTRSPPTCPSEAEPGPKVSNPHSPKKKDRFRIRSTGNLVYPNCFRMASHRSRLRCDDNVVVVSCCCCCCLPTPALTPRLPTRNFTVDSSIKIHPPIVHLYCRPQSQPGDIVPLVSPR